MRNSIGVAPALAELKTLVDNAISEKPLAPEVEISVLVDKINREYILFLFITNHSSGLEKYIELITVNADMLKKNEAKNFKGIINSVDLEHTNKLSLLAKLFSKGLELIIETDIREDGWKAVIFTGKVYDNPFKTEPFDLNDFGQLFFEYV